MGQDVLELGKEFNKEITNCPICGETVNLTDPIESNGEGMAYGKISCSSPDCTFKAQERWIHDKTIVEQK